MHSVYVIIAAVLATVVTRQAALFLPTRIKNSRFISYLANYLPVASFGLLVVYSLKDTSFGSSPYGLPEMIGVSIIVVLQLWKDNVLLTITVSSTIYILLVNTIF